MVSKKIVGITSTIEDHLNTKSVVVAQNYIQAVIRSGAVPFVLPLGPDLLAESMVSVCDGIILTGGEDVCPLSYHENPAPQIQKTNNKRDTFESALVTQAVQQKKPILAICRGITMLNVALGGTVIQDIYTANKQAINHYQQASTTEATHPVELIETSRLYQIFQKKELQVNSLHHQAIGLLAPGLAIAALAPDNTIEAVEGKAADPFILGVQWHPEELATEDAQMQQLFQAFIHSCSEKTTL